MGQLQARFPSFVFKQRAHFAGRLDLGVFVVVDSDVEVQAADAGQGLLHARLEVDAGLFELEDRRALHFVAVIIVLVLMFVFVLVLVLLFMLVVLIVVFIFVAVAVRESGQSVVGLQAAH